ncbi:hypothetical protein C8Q79DRAFT_1007712 [Trametes meyenii]|nr:hypothetical protein C8Q79DRAFT_1007712 [Trametes meyenii]
MAPTSNNSTRATTSSQPSSSGEDPLEITRALKQRLQVAASKEERRTSRKSLCIQRSSKHQCSFCGDKSEYPSGRAPSTSQSPEWHLAARYCNAACQRADYKRRHKREYADFVHPPALKQFATEPFGDAQYPTSPVFAKGHSQGIGCWISHAGRFNSELHCLDDEMDELSDAEVAARRRTIKADYLWAADYNANGDTMLALAILLLSFPGRAHKAILKHKVDIDNVSVSQGEGRSFALISPPYDPWLKRPCIRLRVFNGAEHDTPAAPPPPSVLDAKEAIVVLHPGDYALFHAFFRVGNGKTLTRDFHALAPIRAFNLVCAPYHDAYYADFFAEGEVAFVEGHYGARHAELARVQQALDKVIDETLDKVMPMPDFDA